MQREAHVGEFLLADEGLEVGASRVARLAEPAGVAAHLERERLAVLEARPAVKADAVDAEHGELDHQRVTLLAVGVVARRALHAAHAAVLEALAAPKAWAPLKSGRSVRPRRGLRDGRGPLHDRATRARWGGNATTVDNNGRLRPRQRPRGSHTCTGPKRAASV